MSEQDERIAKLTKAQREVYDAMRAGAKAYYMRYMGRFNPNAYWFVSGLPGKKTRQIEKLAELGLVRINREKWGDATAEVVP